MRKTLEDVLTPEAERDEYIFHTPMHVELASDVAGLKKGDRCRLMSISRDRLTVTLGHETAQLAPAEITPGVFDKLKRAFLDCELPCSQCGGDGYRIDFEDDRPVRDACYRCGTSGYENTALFRYHAIRGVAYILAERQMNRSLAAERLDPDADYDFATAAAESGCSQREFMQSRIDDLGPEYEHALAVLLEQGQEDFVNALVAELNPYDEEQLFLESHRFVRMEEHGHVWYVLIDSAEYADRMLPPLSVIMGERSADEWFDAPDPRDFRHEQEAPDDDDIPF